MKKLLLGTLVCASFLWADFGYQQTSRITGGAMAGMMSAMGAISRQAREPMVSTMLVKGDRMAHITSRSAVITDLKSETITTIDFQRKTYSVVTFAQMAEMLAQAGKQAQAGKGTESPDLNVKVSVKETAETRQFAGLNARQVIMTVEMETTDPKSGNKGSMLMVMDMWMAPTAPGYEEVRKFHARMAQKALSVPGSGLGGLGAGRSDMAKGMAEASKQMAKIGGMPVYYVTKMTVKGMGQPGGEGSEQQPRAGNQEQQPQQQEQQQAEKPSIGSVLGGRLGGLGGLGRRRKPQQEQEQQPALSQNQGQAQSQGSRPAAEPGVLMEVTTELSNFSSGPADDSKFEVPAGFKQVESDTLRRRGR